MQTFIIYTGNSQRVRYWSPMALWASETGTSLTTKQSWRVLESMLSRLLRSSLQITVKHHFNADERFLRLARRETDVAQGRGQRHKGKRRLSFKKDRGAQTLKTVHGGMVKKGVRITNFSQPATDVIIWCLVVSIVHFRGGNESEYQKDERCSGKCGVGSLSPLLASSFQKTMHSALHDQIGTGLRAMERPIRLIDCCDTEIDPETIGRQLLP